MLKSNNFVQFLSKKALQIWLPFATSYMCESAFSTLEITKTNHKA